MYDAIGGVELQYIILPLHIAQSPYYGSHHCLRVVHHVFLASRTRPGSTMRKWYIFNRSIEGGGYSGMRWDEVRIMIRVRITHITYNTHIKYTYTIYTYIHTHLHK